MIIVIGADHGGYRLKNSLKAYISDRGHTVIDVGTHGEEPVDYPDSARAAVRVLLDGRADRGVLICGSGVGASIAANKFRGIRAGLCHDTFSAHQGVEDDEMNLLCLGARVVGTELAKEITGVFLDAVFSHAERHVRRVGKIAEIERECVGKEERAGKKPGR